MTVPDRDGTLPLLLWSSPLSVSPSPTHSSPLSEPLIDSTRGRPQSKSGEKYGMIFFCCKLHNICVGVFFFPFSVSENSASSFPACSVRWKAGKVMEPWEQVAKSMSAWKNNKKTNKRSKKPPRAQIRSLKLQMGKTREKWRTMASHQNWEKNFISKLKTKIAKKN